MMRHSRRGIDERREKLLMAEDQNPVRTKAREQTGRFAPLALRIGRSSRRVISWRGSGFDRSDILIAIVCGVPVCLLFSALAIAVAADAQGSVSSLTSWAKWSGVCALVTLAFVALFSKDGS